MTDFDIKYSALRRAVIENEFMRLNDRQREAVFKTEGPLLLLAGAGSGKTTVLINRIINLLRFGRAYECDSAPQWASDAELSRLALAVGDPAALEADELARLCAVNHPRPWEIIAITFTNKAAGELRERLEAACGDSARDIWAHTFHTACLRILRPNIERMGYSRSFTIYDEDDKKKLLRDVIRDMGFDEKKFDPKMVANEISRAKDSLLSSEDYLDENEGDLFRKKIGEFYAKYQKRMQDANALDFDDIIFLTVRLLRELEDVREKYQNQFKYVLVDEYQDTNHAQYELCRLLAGKWRNLCVVGDDDQSIYKFRGATIANIMEFERQYPDAVTIRLEQNYRSTANILNAANGVISNNYSRKGKSLWTDRGQGEKIRLFVGETQEEEAQFIAKTIFEGYSSGDKLKDFTVLYRNHALSNNLEAAFKRNSIPYRIVSGLRFFDRAEVKDMLAYLWLVSNPSDTVRLARIINNPPRKIGAKTLEALAMIAERDGISAFGAAENARIFPKLSRAADALTAFAASINKVIACKFDTPLADLYDLLLQESGYLAALEQQNSVEARGRIENVLELKSNIADYCARAENPTLEGFLEEIALLADIDRYDTEADAVTMMTMHSAKGLEFPSVFLCGAEEGLFPSYRSMESEEEIEEERRLCYVAMTRAKKNLYITCAKRRMIYGQTAYSKPSRFTEEIPAECVNATVPSPPSLLYTPKRVEKKAPYNAFPKVSVAFGSMSEKGSDVKCKNFTPGDRIKHKAFGEGIVNAATPTGGDILLEIAFDTAGKKLMMAKTAAQFIEKL